MAPTAKEREDYTHPEKVYKDLAYSPNGTCPPELREKRKGHDPRYYNPRETNEELCWVCGWNSHNEVWSSYGSRVRIFHTRANIGIWEVGSRWLIRDQPNDTSLGNDFITQDFLRQHQPKLDIPLVKEMRRLSAPTDKVHITLMSRAEGVGLNTIWDALSPEQKTNYTNHLRHAIKQWRQFKSPVAKNIDDSVVYDCVIGHCHRRRIPSCVKMGRSTDEWFKNLEPDLRLGISILLKTEDPVIIEERFQELRKNFPKSEPYVLTHGDLNFTNIIVKDDKIEAIIDWEWSGYLPWWVERWLSMIGGNDQTDELFDKLWAEMEGELDEDTFREEVLGNVAPVIKAWKACMWHTEHTNTTQMWMRPGFCECKPYAGRFKWDQIGNFSEHILKDSDAVDEAARNRFFKK